MNEEFSFAGPPLCVVGNVNRDVKLLGVPASSGLLCDGETPVAEVAETVGGGGANSACAAAALGASVRFVGKVGDDGLGQHLEQAMERHGVETHLARDSRIATGTTVALGFTSGHRHFLSCLPNNESLVFEDLDLAALDGCTHLLRADVWFSPAMLDGGNRKLFAEAQRRGITTSLDINFDPQRSGAASSAELTLRKESLRGVLDVVDVAHGNIEELQEFAGRPDLESTLPQLAEWGVKAVVIHMGAQGAGYYSDGSLTIEPPDPACSPVNSTGTGDVLSMCMILLHGRHDLSPQQKLRRSNRIVREFMEGHRVMIPAI